jgi:hypothetical protein
MVTVEQGCGNYGLRKPANKVHASLPGCILIRPFFSFHSRQSAPAKVVIANVPSFTQINNACELPVGFERRIRVWASSHGSEQL